MKLKYGALTLDFITLSSNLALNVNRFAQVLEKLWTGWESREDLFLWGLGLKWVPKMETGDS